MNKWVIGLVFLIVVLGGGYFVVKSMKNNTPAPTPTSAVQQQTTQPTAQASSAAVMQEITVEGNEFAFTPSTLTLKQGEEAKITFKNTGKFPHNFTISDLNVKSKTIKPGEEDTVTFTPDKTGSFTYVCTVPGHADKGMKGTLTIK